MMPGLLKNEGCQITLHFRVMNRFYEVGYVLTLCFLKIISVWNKACFIVGERIWPEWVEAHPQVNKKSVF